MSSFVVCPGVGSVHPRQSVRSSAVSFLTSEESREVDHTEVLMLGPGHFDFQDVVRERLRRMVGRLARRWNFHDFGGLVLDSTMVSEGGGE